MEAVIKVGGSLAEDPVSLKTLCRELGKLAQNYRIMIVPGGGELADIIRKYDRAYNLPNTTAHKMAVLAMDQYGLLLQSLSPNSFATYSLEKARRAGKGRLPIFLPSKLMFLKDPLENSWDVTSDSIAAYIAISIRAKKLILAKNVDGIFTHDPKRTSEAILRREIPASELLSWKETTCVDRALPKLLLETRVECYVVNGTHPERVKAIIGGEKPTSTYIVPG